MKLARWARSPASFDQERRPGGTGVRGHEASGLFRPRAGQKGRTDAEKDWAYLSLVLAAVAAARIFDIPSVLGGFWGRGMIEIKGLTVTYPDGTRALESVGFSVPEGERVALVGANGAGKSTF